MKGCCRRTAAALLLALLALAPAATAQERVEGGGSFNDAPLLEPGSFRDTIRPGEKLFYAVEMAEGERLRATVTISGAPSLFAYADLRLYSPLRAEDVPAHDNVVLSNRVNVLRTSSDVVGAGDEEIYGFPGAYFVSVEARHLEEQEIQYRLRLDIEVTGTTVTPTVGPTVGPTPTVAESPGPTAAPPGERSGPPTGSLVGIGVLSFGIGLLAGAAAVGVWRFLRVSGRLP